MTSQSKRLNSFDCGFGLSRRQWAIATTILSVVGLSIIIARYPNWEMAAYQSVAPILEVPFPAVSVCPDRLPPQLVYQRVINLISINEAEKLLPEIMKTAKMTLLTGVADITKHQLLFSKLMDELPPVIKMNERERREVFPTIYEEWFYKVDRLYHDDCENEGPYCTFHKDIMDVIHDLEMSLRFQKWAQIQKRNATTDNVSQNSKSPLIMDFFRTLTDQFFVKSNGPNVSNFIEYLKDILIKDSMEKVKTEAGTTKSDFKTVRRIKNCTTISGSQCKIPFTSKGIDYNECAYDESINRTWCQVGQSSNYWELCEGCQQKVDSFGNPVESCYAEAGPDAGHECKFPFSLEGSSNIIRVCIVHKDNKTSAPWCPTQVMKNGQFNAASDKWGYCSKNCPVANRFRVDGRCGGDYQLNTYGPGLCKSLQGQCCSPSGWCGSTPDHCQCPGCEKYAPNSGQECQYKSVYGHEGGVYIDLYHDTAQLIQSLRTFILFGASMPFCQNAPLLRNLVKQLQQARPYHSTLAILRIHNNLKRYEQLTKDFLEGNCTRDSDKMYLTTEMKNRSLVNLDTVFKDIEYLSHPDRINLPTEDCISSMETECHYPTSQAEQNMCTCQCQKIIKLEIYKLYRTLLRMPETANRMNLAVAMWGVLNIVKKANKKDLEQKIRNEISSAEKLMFFDDYSVSNGLINFIHEAINNLYIESKLNTSDPIPEDFTRRQQQLFLKALFQETASNISEEYHNRMHGTNNFLMNHDKIPSGIIPYCTFNMSSQHKFSTTYSMDSSMNTDQVEKCRLFRPEINHKVCYTFRTVPLYKSGVRSLGCDDREKCDSLHGEKLVFLLDNYDWHFFGKDSDKKTGFWLYVHSHLSGLDPARDSGVHIEPSHDKVLNNLVVRYGAKLVSLTNDAKQLGSASRGCRLKDETNYKDLFEIFQFYSESNCQWECLWKLVDRRCGCRPWFMPTPSTNKKVCNDEGQECFIKLSRSVQDKRMVDAMCPCPPTCETFEYEINTEVQRNKIAQGYLKLMSKNILKYANMLQVLSIDNASSLLGNIESDEQLGPAPSFEKTVQQRLKGDGLMVITVEPDQAGQMVRMNIVEERGDLNDQISWAGGIIDLLSGLSVMSFFDILWIGLSGLLNYCSKKGRDLDLGKSCKGAETVIKGLKKKRRETEASAAMQRQAFDKKINDLLEEKTRFRRKSSVMDHVKVEDLAFAGGISKGDAFDELFHYYSH